LDIYINPRLTALVGRENGEHVFDHLAKNKIVFSELEDKYESISLIIPDKILTINKSFFLGLFETRIQKLGTDGFQKKYKFKASDRIQKKIKRYIDTALLSASMKDILNA